MGDKQRTSMGGSAHLGGKVCISYHLRSRVDRTGRRIRCLRRWDARVGPHPRPVGLDARAGLRAPHPRAGPAPPPRTGRCTPVAPRMWSQWQFTRTEAHAVRRSARAGAGLRPLIFSRRGIASAHLRLILTPPRAANGPFAHASIQSSQRRHPPQPDESPTTSSAALADD
jgi:hypothetical protein